MLQPSRHVKFGLSLFHFPPRRTGQTQMRDRRTAVTEIVVAPGTIGAWARAQRIHDDHAAAMVTLDGRQLGQLPLPHNFCSRTLPMINGQQTFLCALGMNHKRACPMRIAEAATTVLSVMEKSSQPILAAGSPFMRRPCFVAVLLKLLVAVSTVAPFFFIVRLSPASASTTMTSPWA